MSTCRIAEYHPNAIEGSIGAIAIVALRYDRYPPEIRADRIHLAYAIILTEVAHGIGRLPTLKRMKLRTRVHIDFMRTYETICIAVLSRIVYDYDRVTILTDSS